MRTARTTGLVLAVAGLLVSGCAELGPLASRSEALEADRHAVTLLRRVGSSKEALLNTLAWLARISGGADGGGWFATHPGTGDRIQLLRQMP
jgi:predicted Zn-dependent protease